MSLDSAFAPRRAEAVRAAGAPRVVLALSRRLLLEALVRVLEDAGLTVVSRCTTPRRLRACLGGGAEVVLLDAAVGDDGLEEPVAVVRAVAPRARIVLLARAVDARLAQQSLRLALDGVVLELDTPGDVVAALRAVHDGHAVFPAGWLAAARRHAIADGGLSARQLEVLELLAEGLPNDVIARRLFISTNTVKFHVAAIYERLGVRNRVQAAHALDQLRAAS